MQVILQKKKKWGWGGWGGVGHNDIVKELNEEINKKKILASSLYAMPKCLIIIMWLLSHLVFNSGIMYPQELQ